METGTTGGGGRCYSIVTVEERERCNGELGGEVDKTVEVETGTPGTRPGVRRWNSILRELERIAEWKKKEITPGGASEKGKIVALGLTRTGEGDTEQVERES